MNRHSWIVPVCVAVLCSSFFALPTYLLAGHTPGLAGRTHLIVKEHNLKVLRATSVSTLACPPNVTLELQELHRDGSLSAGSYVVPSDRVFIATDVFVRFISSSPDCFTPGALQVQIGSNNVARATFGGSFGAQSTCSCLGAAGQFSLSGGIPFSPGSMIQVTSAGDVRQTYEYTVLGYETLDVPPLGE
jgi:hypothetical protein